MSLPPMPRFRTERQLRKLSKRALAMECWAAGVNYEEANESAAEAWGVIAELVEVIEGRRIVDATKLATLKNHKAHVESCRAGSCESEFHVLVRAGLASVGS